MRPMFMGFVRTAGLLLMFFTAGAARAESATINVHGANASDPGAKTKNIPASLNAYKSVLQATTYGTFVDAGGQSVSAAKGATASGSTGGYSVEITVNSASGGKAKVDVTVKKGGKAINNPAACNLTKGEPISMQFGDGNAPTIIILTLQSTD